MPTMIKKGPEQGALAPGHWRVWGLNKRNPIVFVTCPTCGSLALLDHWVEPDGKLRPSLQCPKEGCFHEDGVRLEDWTPPGPGVTLSPEGP